MNKYEARAEQQRKAALRFSLMIWTAGIALVVVVLLILGLSSSAPNGFFTKGAIVAAALLLLILRQLNRRLRRTGPKAAQPDPQSTLKLD